MTNQIIKKILSLLLPAIVFLLGCFGLFYLRNQNDKLEAEIKSSIQVSLNKEQAYLEIFRMQWILEQNRINSNIQIVDKDNNSYQLAALSQLSPKPTYVLNFRYDACQDCILQEIGLIKNTIIGQFNVIVIISFDSINEYKAYIQSNSISLPVYYLEKSKNIIDGLTYDFGVYGFVLKDNSEIIFPHIANSGLSELSVTYYQLLLDKAPDLS